MLSLGRRWHLWRRKRAQMRRRRILNAEADARLAGRDARLEKGAK